MDGLKGPEEVFVFVGVGPHGRVLSMQQRDLYSGNTFVLAWQHFFVLHHLLDAKPFAV